MDECVRKGWRYLELRPNHVYELTHREFVLLCEENAERTHDENEREAMYAIIYAAASRGKGKQGKLPSVHELYKRPENEVEASNGEDKLDPIEQQRHAEEWLAQFDLTSLSGEGEK